MISALRKRRVRADAAPSRFFLFPVLLAAAFCSSSVKADDRDDSLHVKLTPSWYSASDGNDAADLNLRVNKGPHAGWIAYYRDRSGFRQPRTGYEYTTDQGWLHLVSSVQAASGGFIGGSLNAQLGGDTYAIAGFGRTNLHPYYNVNFDPNDAITLGAGRKFGEATEVMVYQVRDDRLDTGQRVTHLYVHRNLSEKRRLSIDIARKSGLDSDNVRVAGTMLTLTYAVGDVFLRVARDPYANFGPATQTRISLGLAY